MTTQISAKAKIFFLCFVFCFTNAACNIRGAIDGRNSPQFPAHLEKVKQFTNNYSGAKVYKAIDHSRNDLNVLVKGHTNRFEVEREVNALNLLATVDAPYFEKLIDRFQAKAGYRMEHYMIKTFIEGGHYDNFNLSNGTKKVKSETIFFLKKYNLIFLFFSKPL